MRKSNLYRDDENHLCAFMKPRIRGVTSEKQKRRQAMSRNILFGFPARLFFRGGGPQALGRPPARPTEYAFRRGFALPAVASSCTSAQKINPHTTLKEAQTKQKTLKYFRPRRVIITQGRSFAVYGRKGYGFITKARCCF